jgi:hypothetical protein
VNVIVVDINPRAIETMPTNRRKAIKLKKAKKLKQQKRYEHLRHKKLITALASIGEPKQPFWDIRTITGTLIDIGITPLELAQVGWI